MLFILLCKARILKSKEQFSNVSIFRNAQELFSGHSIKHLLAAAGCYCILLMLQKKERSSIAEVAVSTEEIQTNNAFKLRVHSLTATL